MTDKLAIIKNAIEQFVPIHKALNLEVTEIEDQKIVIKVPFSPMVIGDSRSNRWHGGILSMVMDVAGGMVGATTFESFNDKVSTVDMRVDYLEPPKAEDLYIKGEVVRLGNRIMVSKMKAYHKDSPNYLAKGKGVYYILREKDKK